MTHEEKMQQHTPTPAPIAQDCPPPPPSPPPAPSIQYHDADFDCEAQAFKTEAQAKLDKIPIMSPEEVVLLGLHSQACPQQRQDGEEEEAKEEAWESFHARHKRVPFFKKRRYLPLEFPELCPGRNAQLLLELGCGTGSSLAAILEVNPTIKCLGCDISPSALRHLHENLKQCEDGGRLKTFVFDIAMQQQQDEEEGEGTLPRELAARGSMDIVLLIFTLSAIADLDNAHVRCLRLAQESLRPGGLLLFRDYAYYDEKMLRAKKRLSDNLFIRADNTLAYFHSVESFKSVISACGGWKILECKYACVYNKNRASGQTLYRVFLHVKLCKL